MSKPARKRLRAFIRQCGSHAAAVLRRRETPGVALRAVAKDARRLLHKLHAQPDEEGRRKAKQYTNRGVRAYNEADYVKALFYFEKSTKSDENYALGWLYLGDAHHKLQHATEAIEAWQRAAKVGYGTETGDRAVGHLNSAMRKVREQFHA